MNNLTTEHDVTRKRTYRFKYERYRWEGVEVVVQANQVGDAKLIAEAMLADAPWQVTDIGDPTVESWSQN